MDNTKIRGKVIDREAQRLGVGSAQKAPDADIALASQGDAGAAARILALMGGEDRLVQARTASGLIKGAAAPLWDYVLEYAGLGTWAGRKVNLPGSIRRRTLMPRLTALFLDRRDGSAGREREAVLMRGLGSPEARVRRFAATVLGQWESYVDPGSLVPLLTDPDVGVRLRAARALGRMGDPQAVPALIEALGHSDDLIAGEAADALALMGEAALQPLIEVLGNRDPHLRWHAAKALGQMGDPRAADALIFALNDEDFGVRWLAAKGLATMGSRAVVPLLRTLRTRVMTPWLAEGAIHVLKNIREPDVIVLVQELERRLGDSYANVEVPLEADRVLRKLEGVVQ